MKASTFELELKKILTEHTLSSVFQPIFDCRRGKIIGYEALTRGPSDSPLHSPEQLFQAATERQLLSELEVLCRQKSISAFKDKQLKGLLFLNISPMALLEPDYPQGETLKLLAQLDLHPQQVVIELSEKYPSLDIDKLCRALNYYRNLGFKTAIDDLGSGYSDLRLWSELQPDFVKIDRHFIHGIDQDSVKREFVRGISDISNNLSCQVIAEGIETESEFSTVRTLGIDLCQGYYLAKPDAHPELTSFNSNLLTQPSTAHRYQDTAYSLCSFVQPVMPGNTLKQVWQAFQNTPTYSSLPVVDNGKTLGLIHKSKLLELFSSDFGKALHSKKPVREYMTLNAIIVDKNTQLDDLSDLVTNEGDMYVRQHFVIKHQETYLGMGSTRELLKKITETKLTNARYSNPLTLLPGNVPINQHIESLIKAHKPFHIAYFDIDNFKPFNDIYGYRKGDLVIQTLAKIILEQVNPQNNFVGHVGGDDFIVVFEDSNYVANCREIIAKFSSCQREFYSEEHLKKGVITGKDRFGVQREFELSRVSVGIVNSCFKINSVEEYAQFAASAKHQAKANKITGICELEIEKEKQAKPIYAVNH